MLPEEAKDLQKAMPLKNLEGGTGTERMDKNSGCAGRAYRQKKNRKGSQNGEKDILERGIQIRRKKRGKNPEYEKEDMDEGLGSL